MDFKDIWMRWHGMEIIALYNTGNPGHDNADETDQYYYKYSSLGSVLLHHVTRTIIIVWITLPTTLITRFVLKGFLYSTKLLVCQNY